MLAAISGTAVVSKQAVAAKSVDRTVVAATKPKAKAPAKKVAATVRGGWAQRMRGCAVLLWRRHARVRKPSRSHSNVAPSRRPRTSGLATATALMRRSGTAPTVSFTFR
jgi:hypothetical protein